MHRSNEVQGGLLAGRGMTRDLAIDYNTGDLRLAPSNDFAVRSGTEVVQQRIRVRLRIIQGEWPLDPTGGQLGSRLVDAMRSPSWRAMEEIALVIREALEPMEDIRVRSVEVNVDAKDSRKINVLIAYLATENVGAADEDVQNFTTTLKAGA